MKRLLCTLLVLLMALPALPALAEGEVNVYNWEDYISEEALALFEQETGIQVNYMRFTTNEDMLVQVRADPSNYDVIFPSDYIIERLMAEDLLEELNHENIPNAALTLDWLQEASYDPQMRYSVPYMWARSASCIIPPWSRRRLPAGRPCGTRRIWTTCSCSIPSAIRWA